MRKIDLVRAVVVGLCLSLVAGCSFFGKKDESLDATSDKLFAEAKEALNSGDYNRAVKLFESFEAKFPYGAQAQQAMVDAAWANYKVGEYAAAVSGAERFIKLYPTNPNVDYAYYLKGLALFGDELGLFRFLANEDISERDPKGRKEAYTTFRELSEKFPNSQYANDARLRQQHLLNSLSEYEVHVARYYFNRGAFVAAANRAQLCITTYPETPAAEKALAILADSYTALGKTDLANDTKRVYAKSFPKAAEAATTKKPWWKLW
jgi:outer membrane protein assembly factor BamD